MKTKKYLVVVYFLPIICLLGTMLLLQRCTSLSNVLQYIVAVFIGIVAFLVLGTIANIKLQLNDETPEDKLLGKKEYYFGSAVGTILFSLFFWGLDVNMGAMLGRISSVVSFKNMILGSVLFGIIFSFRKRINIKRVKYVFILIILITVAWSYYRPQVLQDTYNYEAYWLNVLQVFKGIPYSSAENSFYGHYALIMLPFFKILGLNIYTVALSQSIEAVVILCMFMYSIEKICENEAVKVLADFLVGLFFLSAEVTTFIYPQGFPHRILFVAILIAWGTKCVYQTKQCVTSWYIGYLICTFGIIWNTEVGVVLAIVWTGLCIAYLIKAGTLKWWLFGAQIVSLALSVCLAWLIVSTINRYFFGGGYLNFLQFIYPLGSPFVSGISADPNFLIASWVFALIVFFCAFFAGFWKIIRKEGDSLSLMWVFLSAISILLFPYYYNRAAYLNLKLVSYFEIILLFASFIDYMTSYIRNQNKQSQISCIYNSCVNGAALVCAILACVLFFRIPDIISSVRNSQDCSELDLYLETLDDEMPDDVIFWGEQSAFYELSMENATACTYNSINTTEDSWNKFKELIFAGENVIAICGNELQQALDNLEYLTGITSDDLYKIYYVSKVDIPYSTNKIYSFLLLEPK